MSKRIYRLLLVGGYAVLVGIAIWAGAKSCQPNHKLHSYGGESIQVQVTFETETTLDKDQVFTCGFLASNGHFICAPYGLIEEEMKSPPATKELRPYKGGNQL